MAKSTARLEQPSQGEGEMPCQCQTYRVGSGQLGDYARVALNKLSSLVLLFLSVFLAHNKSVKKKPKLAAMATIQSAVGRAGVRVSFN
jgi:hypothetical protein